MKKALPLLIILISFSTFSFAQAGTLDSSFGINGEAKISINGSGSASLSAIQDDGKIILAGNIVYSQNYFLVRLLPDSRIDSSFGVNGKVTKAIDSTVYPYLHAITLQKDGKILLGGTVNNYNDFLLLRYKNNGTPDSTFGINGQVTTRINPYSYLEVLSLEVQEDGKIIAAGHANATGIMVRYNSNGSIDSTFSNGIIPPVGVKPVFAVVSSKILPDGKFITANEQFEDTLDFSLVYLGIKRFQSNGVLDTTFGIHGDARGNFFNSKPKDLALLKNNDLIIVGSAFDSSIISKFKADGSVDSSFGKNGNVFTNFGGNGTSANSVLIQDDGKILVTASQYVFENPYITPIGYEIGRFDTNGKVDSTFGINGVTTLILNRSPIFSLYDIDKSFLLQKDGKIIVVGYKDNGFIYVYRLKGDEPETINIKKNISIKEGNTGLTAAVFQLVLNKASALPVSVKIATIDGTAINGADYNGNSATITIKPGKLSAKVTVNIIGDAVREPNETFFLVISGPVNANLGEMDTATCLIKNDDAGFVVNTIQQDELNQLSNLKVYPNPAKDNLQIDGLSSTSKTTLSITDISGNRILSRTVTGNNYNWNISNLISGSYILNIAIKGKVITRTFIKQ